MTFPSAIEFNSINIKTAVKIKYSFPINVGFSLKELYFC